MATPALAAPVHAEVEAASGDEEIPLFATIDGEVRYSYELTERNGTCNCYGNKNDGVILFWDVPSITCSCESLNLPSMAHISNMAFCGFDYPAPFGWPLSFLPATPFMKVLLDVANNLDQCHKILVFLPNAVICMLIAHFIRME